MANIIKLKQSAVQGKVPLASQLVQGEIALNTADEKIYTRNSSGNIVELGKGSEYTSANSAPASPTDGDHWFDPQTGILYVRVTDQWLDIATAGGAPTNVFSNATSAPTSPTLGDSWYNPSTSEYATRVEDSSGVDFWHVHTSFGLYTSNTVIDGMYSVIYTYTQNEIADGGSSASAFSAAINGGTA
jgi:hypothetical protein